MKHIAFLFYLLATPLYAGDVMIDDAFARVSRPNAPAGAAFLVIHNMGEEDDRLIGVDSAIAQMVQLHTHEESADGVMKMMHVKEGFEIKAGETHELARGGDHIMFMGIKGPINEGDEIPVTLVFQNAGKIDVVIKVDNERGQMGHDKMDHSGHKMKKGNGS